ncbi:MAG: CPBP family intramembrane glutamic endopeptidase [Cellulosilyticaceae bacterium]
MFSNDVGLFKEAKEAKKLPNIVTGIIWAFVLLVVGQTIGMIVNDALKGVITNSNVASLVERINNFIYITLLVFARVKFIEKRKIRSLGFQPEGFIIKYLLGFGIGFILFSSVVLILMVTGQVTINTAPETPVGMLALSGVLILIPGWIIQSATEEILTRGWLMNVLGARYNVAVGLIVSASLFGILHLANPNISILAVANIVLVGIFFGLYMMKTGSIWGICGIHAAWNWAQGNVYGFEVSGGKSDVGSLIALKSVGKDWFTGGFFGPEAGLAATIVLFVAVIIIYIVLKKSPRKEG